MVTTTEDQDADPQAGQSLVIAATPARDFEAEVMVKSSVWILKRSSSKSETTRPSSSPPFSSPLRDLQSHRHDARRAPRLRPAGHQRLCQTLTRPGHPSPARCASGSEG